jgi:hypothetical protein
MTRASKLVARQAEDEGLWSIPFDRLETIHEACLRIALRKLHAAVEADEADKKSRSEPNAPSGT